MCGGGGVVADRLVSFCLRAQHIKLLAVHTYMHTCIHFSPWLSICINAVLSIMGRAGQITHFGRTSYGLNDTLLWIGARSRVQLYPQHLLTTVTAAAGACAGCCVVDQAPWGQPINIPYTITIDRSPATSKRTLTFTVTGCPVGLEVKVSAVGGPVLTTAVAVGGVAQFTDVPWTSDTGSVKAECATGSVEEPVTFADANTNLEHGTAVVTDTINWPNWSSYPPGTDAPTNPTLAVTTGTYPAPGTTITGSTTYQYTWTVSNLMFCVTDAPVCGEAVICIHANMPRCCTQT